MRLHSDIITRDDIYEATQEAGKNVVFAEVTEHGSRARRRAFEVKLTGTSSRRPNSGKHGAGDLDDRAATWDEWGMFLADLFGADPDMIVGTPGRPVYDGAVNFHLATVYRFMYLTPDRQHKNHKWNNTGMSWVWECDCGAVMDTSFMHIKREEQ